MLVKKVEGRNIVWLSKFNKYLIANDIILEVLRGVEEGVANEMILNKILKSRPDIQKNVLIELIDRAESFHCRINKKATNPGLKVFSKKKYSSFFSEKFYLIHKFIFKIQYETKYHELIIHPTFAHLEQKNKLKFDFNYQIYNDNNSIVLLKNDSFIGKWDKVNTHVFEGQVSMQILIDIYKKTEAEWMGVFHASAVGNGKEVIMFPGSSGNGKSTSLALLNASGYNCVADDFTPIDINKRVHTYPASISIKKSSLDVLLPFYPELNNSIEFNVKKNKSVKYLRPHHINFNEKLKCKALVFIKYDPNVDLKISVMTKIQAFQQLVPDSWISPMKKNANIFLDWFFELTSYQLIYSDNDKMISTVAKIFNDEL